MSNTPSLLSTSCSHFLSVRHRELRALPTTTPSSIISFLMEFWGIEVKPGQSVKCEPGDDRILHLSQASLGEIKEKGSENVPIFVKVNDQKLVIGTLCKDKCAQIQYDLVFDKEFELSHGSKNISVYFVGYKSAYQGYESEDDLYDTTSEDELEIDEKANGKPSKKEQGKSATEKAAVGKDNNVAEKLKAKIEKPNKEQVKVDKKVEDNDDDDDSDDEDSEEDSDDEDMVQAAEDSSGEDDDQSSEEEATPAKVEADKKRKADSAAKTPIPDKKAKVVAPTGNKKSGGDGKKSGHVHVATPHPAKQGGKPQPSPKSGGSVTCKPCNRTFNSENALQAHSKAKHAAGTK